MDFHGNSRKAQLQHQVSHFIKFQVSIKAKQNIFKTSEQRLNNAAKIFRKVYF